MNRETIERAASSYADSIPQSDERKRYCREDFIAGVEWATEYIYHYLIDEMMKSETEKTSQDLPKNNS